MGLVCQRYMEGVMNEENGHDHSVERRHSAKFCGQCK